MDYLEEIKEDVKNYIDENNIIITEDNKEEIEEQLNDDLWAEDSVTGNASGSYTFSTYQAEENDVTIRCYLLSQAISEVIEEIV